MKMGNVIILSFDSATSGVFVQPFNGTIYYSLYQRKLFFLFLDTDKTYYLTSVNDFLTLLKFHMYGTNK